MSRALRVLHVIPSVGPHRGGPSVALEVMTRALTQAGVAVQVATTDDDSPGRIKVPLRQAVERDGAIWHYFPRQMRFYTVSLPLKGWLARHVDRFDVVHVHAVFSHASVHACRSARRARVPYIVRPLGVLAPYGLRQRALLKRMSLRFIERPLLDGAAAIHCTSAAEEADVRRLDAQWRTAVVPLGVDTDCYKPSPLHTEPYALFLARLHPKKGIELLLSAAAQVPELKLVIAGGGNARYIAQLQEMTGTLGIADRVIWAGHVSGAEKLRMLQSASVFVLPSQAENFGIAVAEALACGVPAVVSDQVAIAPQIARYRAGRVTRVDAGELAAELRAVMASAADRARMATAARSLAVQEFSLRSMTDRLIALYESVRR